VKWDGETGDWEESSAQKTFAKFNIQWAFSAQEANWVYKFLIHDSYLPHQSHEHHIRL